jgi:hypothetical protein
VSVICPGEIKLKENSIDSQGYRLVSQSLRRELPAPVPTRNDVPDRPFEKRTSGVRAEEVCSDVFLDRGLVSHSLEGASENAHAAAHRSNAAG